MLVPSWRLPTLVIIIEVKLLSGRYHAHMWGEAQYGMGEAEWPPSPWRLLRALASAWFRAQPRLPSIKDRDELLEALGRSEPPTLWLPHTSMHEIRYYQPGKYRRYESKKEPEEAGRSKEERGRSKKEPGGSKGGQKFVSALHHDFFAVPQGGHFWFGFNVDLQKQQRDLLTQLLSHLTYFGRSESRARLCIRDKSLPKDVFEVLPNNKQSNRDSQFTYQRVLCTASDFQATDLWSVRNGSGEKSQDKYPKHLVDDLIDNKMPLPDGARWVEYALPEKSLVYEIPFPDRSSEGRDIAVAEVHYRLCRRVPIPAWDIIVVARAFRDAAVDIYKERNQNVEDQNKNSRLLSGRENDGTIARGHQHAYYLPSIDQDTGTIKYFVVRIPGKSLDQGELKALLSIDRIYIGERRYPITVIPEKIVCDAREPQKEEPEERSACCWKSATPFLLPLHYQHIRNMADARLEDQIARSVERLIGERPRVERWRGSNRGSWVAVVRAHQYQRNGGGWTFVRRLGFWVRLTFKKPVSLEEPIGADAHFGAGQFRAIYNQ